MTLITVNNSSQKGFTLIEILAVIFIIAVGVTGVFALVQTTTSSSRLVSYQLTATYLAQEGVELVRSVRDTNWLEDRYTPEDVSWDEDLAESLSDEKYQLDYTLLGQKDSGWDPDFLDYSESRYLNQNENGYNYEPGDKSRFKRRIKLERSPDIIVVRVRVEFEFQGETHKVSSQEKLYKWRK